MRIEKRSMNWVPKLSAYEEAQRLNEKRHKIASEHLNDAQTTAAAFTSARAKQIASVAQMSSYAVRGRISKCA
jgi:hypothetical protein